MGEHEHQLGLFGPEPTGRDEHEAFEIRLNASVPDFDATRLRASLRRLLDYMGDHGWHTNLALVGVAGVRYGARIEELRKAGHPIVREHVHDGVWKYRLLDRGE